MAESTPSGIPLEVQMDEDVVEVAQKEPSRKKAPEMKLEQTAMVVAKPSGLPAPEQEDEEDDDSDLDEIIERVVEVVHARRNGKPVPPRKSAKAAMENPLGEVSALQNPTMGLSPMAWAGIGVGSVLAIGGLVWWWKKKAE